MDRKNYSPKREAALKRVVEEYVNEFAAQIGKGAYSGVRAAEREVQIRAALAPLAERVADEYRRNYLPRGTAADDKTGWLFEEVAA